jgi:hypothetical protein
LIRAKFKFNPRVVKANIDQLVIRVQQKIAFQLLEGIINMNPVLTGRARGNWQVSIGSPSETIMMTNWPSAGEAIQRGAATISSLTTLGAIYLVNNLPYIVPLEQGTSKQAPQGMVQVTLDRVSSQFR